MKKKIKKSYFDTDHFLEDYRYYLKGCGCINKHTKKCLAEKKRKHLADLKEKRRRAKKITMTVGEFEDKLQAERYKDY